jgi:Ca2+-binding RTX toxin-like protein
VLQGGKGKNILIGGDGADFIQGGNSGDLLIAAATAYDANIAANRLALCAIEEEWTHGGNYKEHIMHLIGGGGRNGSFVLNAATVSDDGDVDVLRGGKGKDFFIARVDLAVLDSVDKSKDEMVLNI